MDLRHYKAYNHEEKLSHDIHFTIDHNGHWYFHGSANPGPMKKEALVKLFADKALKEKDGKYFLQTPFESYEVEVEDVPFLINKYDNRGGEVVLITNIGDEVALGQGKKLFLKKPFFTDISLPYIDVRSNMLARLSPKVREDFIEQALEQGCDLEQGDTLYLEIQGVKHPVAKWEG